LAFPTNDFGQEFQSDREIQEFVKTHYPQATFPILGTSHLPENTIYQELQRQMPDNHVRHNFFKYLVNRQGMAVKFYDKQTEPLDIQDDIEELLLTTADAVNPRQFVIK
jgi:glutathione peroxidase-family protein